MIRIHFERSDACCEAHDLDPNDSPQRVVEFDDMDGSWVQFTYESLRTQEGTVLAYLSKDDGCWFYDGQPYSDIVIEFKEG